MDDKTAPVQLAYSLAEMKADVANNDSLHKEALGFREDEVKGKVSSDWEMLLSVGCRGPSKAEVN